MHFRCAVLDLYEAVALEQARVDGPTAESGDRGSRLVLCARRAPIGFEVIEIIPPCGNREKGRLKGHAVGLSGKPGHEVAQRGKVGGNRLLGFAVEDGDEYAKQRRVVIPQGE